MLIAATIGRVQHRCRSNLFEGFDFAVSFYGHRSLRRAEAVTMSHRSSVCGKRLADAVFVLLLCAAMPAAASAADLGLTTGVERGTYYSFGQDLRRLLKSAGINITVHPSNGAVDNVHAITQRPGVQLGIVQSDVLAAIADPAGNSVIRPLARDVRLVLPLYDEEVHVLARGGISDLEGLMGLRVAIGREGSGTYLTALTLFQLAGIVPGAIVATDGAEALTQLRAGRIDAMIYVAGHPVGLLRDGVTRGDGLALVPVTAPPIVDAYATTEIPAGTYLWQPAAVRTVAVKAVLVTHDPGRRHCETIGRFAQYVIAGLGWLVENGHPYWKRVDVEQPVKGSEQYDCVRDYVGGPAASATE